MRTGIYFVKGVEDELTCIIRGLLKLSGAGVKGYTALCESWLKRSAASWMIQKK